VLHYNTLSWFITSATTDHIPEVHSPSAESMDLLFGKLTINNYSQQESPKCSTCMQSQNTTQQTHNHTDNKHTKHTTHTHNKHTKHYI